MDFHVRVSFVVNVEENILDNGLINKLIIC